MLVYVISGLGADSRVFKNIKLKGVRFRFIKWIDPLPGETIASYARRISSQITRRNPILLGISLGGILSVEISKFLKLKKLIILSGVKTREEIPVFYRIVSRVGIARFLPFGILPKLPFLPSFIFGARRYRKLLNRILSDTDQRLLSWAVPRILAWDNRRVPKEYMHIHGDADRIFPIRYIQNCEPVRGGGHLTVLEDSKIVGALIKRSLVGAAK